MPVRTLSGAALLLAILATAIPHTGTPTTNPPAGQGIKGHTYILEDAQGGPQVVFDDGNTIKTLTGVNPENIQSGQETTLKNATQNQNTIQVANIIQNKTTQAASVILTPKVHPVLVVRATWKKGPAISKAPTLKTINTILSQSSTYWKGQTRGIVTFNTLKNYDNIITANNPCSNWGGFVSEVEKKIKYTPQANKHLIIYTPNSPACKWAGLGYIGNNINSGGVITVNGYPYMSVLAHELGHNLGLGHAQLYTCFQGKAQTVDGTSKTCYIHNYSNRYSVMGIASNLAPGAIGGPAEVKLGLTTPQPLLEATPTPLVPLESTRGTRVLTLKMGNDTYYIEYRTKAGQDAQAVNPQNPQGVLVYKAAYGVGVNNESYLLDSNPTVNPLGNPKADNSYITDGNDVMPGGVWVSYQGFNLKVDSQGAQAVIEYTKIVNPPPPPSPTPTPQS